MKATLSIFCLLLWTVCLASDFNQTSVEFGSDNAIG